MIRLTKDQKPEVLENFGDAWLSALKAKIDAGEDPTDSQKAKYRHPDIKLALKAETKGKCAYCESYIFHVNFGDVEHIVPKSRDIDLIFEWANLTVACDVCNTFKSSHEGVIDPYNVEPSEHFMFLGPMIVPLPGSVLGKYSELRLQLNRLDLVERRLSRLKSISDQFIIILNTQDARLRSVLVDDFQNNELSDRAEFAAFCRAFADALKSDGGEEAVQ